MNLEELLRRQAQGETLTDEEINFISMSKSEAELNFDLQDIVASENKTMPSDFASLGQEFQVQTPTAFGSTQNSTLDENLPEGALGYGREFRQYQRQAKRADNQAFKDLFNPNINNQPLTELPHPLTEEQMLSQQTNTPRIGLGTDALKIGQTTNTDVPPPMYSDNGATQQQPKTNNSDLLSQAALYGNILGAGVSLDTALFSLGQSIGTDNKGKANTMRGVGAAGKLLAGGARALTSGIGYEKRNNYVDDFYSEQRRKALMGDYTETAKYPTNTGGRLFADGGEKLNTQIEPTEEEPKENYAVGDIITFRNKQGKLITGTVKSIKDGEIEII